MAPPTKSVCLRGHARTPENVLAGRGCRLCHNERARQHQRPRRRPLRGHRNGRKTHCKRGHEFSPENTYVTKTGVRQCRECRRQVQRYRSRGTFRRASDQAWLAQLRSEPCTYCGGPGGQVDHVVPFSQGGEDAPENWVPACTRCNAEKQTDSMLRFLLGAT